MKFEFYIVLSITTLFTMLFSVAFAGGDLTKQDPIEIRVELGNAEDGLVFSPNSLSFETGKLYKLILFNPSLQKHYFSSAGMASAGNPSAPVPTRIFTAYTAVH